MIISSVAIQIDPRLGFTHFSCCSAAKTPSALNHWHPNSCDIKMKYHINVKAKDVYHVTTVCWQAKTNYNANAIKRTIFQRQQLKQCLYKQQEHHLPEGCVLSVRSCLLSLWCPSQCYVAVTLHLTVFVYVSCSRLLNVC